MQTHWFSNHNLHYLSLSVIVSHPSIHYLSSVICHNMSSYLPQHHGIDCLIEHSNCYLPTSLGSKSHLGQGETSFLGKEPIRSPTWTCFRTTPFLLDNNWDTPYNPIPPQACDPPPGEEGVWSLLRREPFFCSDSLEWDYAHPPLPSWKSGFERGLEREPATQKRVKHAQITIF